MPRLAMRPPGMAKRDTSLVLQQRFGNVSGAASQRLRRGANAMTGLRGSVVGALFVGMTSYAVTALAQPCQKDNECPGDLVCNAGQCQTLSGVTPTPAVVSPPRAVALSTSPPSPAAGLVTVRFEGDSVVLSENNSGQSCRVPCSMQLVPGTHSLVATESGAFGVSIVVGQQGGVFDVSSGDPGMIFGGLLATSVGAIGGAIGLIFVLVADSDSDSSSSYSSDDQGPDMDALGKPLLISGGALLALGIGLLAGAETPSVEQSVTPPRAPGIPMVGLAPTKGGVLMGASLEF